MRIPGGAGNTDWTAAVADNADTTVDAGEITTSTLPVTDAVAGTTAGSLAVAGSVATVTTGTLKANGSITITYNSATAPSVIAKENGTDGQVFALTINGTNYTDTAAGTTATADVDSAKLPTDKTALFKTVLAAPTPRTGSVP